MVDTDKPKPGAQPVREAHAPPMNGTGPAESQPEGGGPLAGQEDVFEQLFRRGPVASALLRLSDGVLLDANDAYLELTGYGRDEVVGRSAEALGIWPAATRRGPAAVDGPVHGVEQVIQRRDGTVRHVLTAVRPLDVRGQDCALAAVTDVTDHKLTEASLREAKEHAEAMARLKSTFLTNLTHEIRTPLTVILGFTSILRQGVRKEYLRFIQLIERSGRRLLLMLDSMLDLAQLEAGTLRVEQRPYQVSDVIQSVMQVLRPLAEDKGLVLEFAAATDRVGARLDHAVLTRVLNNVLDNAIKFTESGRIEVALEERGEWAVIRIRDTGIGIDEAFLPQVFEPFSQESTGLERTHQGSGLGLAVSRRLIELMGGRIEVESKKGKGSIFTIILPREP